ncbi:restriction endonuclease [Erythrobacter sp. GH1-10]|uniref:nSTAND3 domain-containing NTPase n=1 Tax=Erythrobacter sp. GH1-10 TaxID=3349334 RepID=UPI00387826BA
MNHDFSKLSGLDFEELVHDLLEEEWGLKLEIFGPGKDGGIDLRALGPNDKAVIIQCKNYQRSGFAALRSTMKNKELPKIQKLKPARYVLVTSCDLTVGQKDDLFQILKPHVRTKKDIIGGAELEKRLEKNPEVVKRHYKLWMSSVSVLEKVLHAAEHEQTQAQVDRITRKLPLFVQTDAYGRAMSSLDEHRIVIVSGAPGIGKSTIADMLLYAHIADGFAPAVIKTGLAEGRRLASSTKPTLFYFDDFLGQTFLGDRPDFLGRKEDADLVDFIDWVRCHKSHRFVLTTREHILSDALQRSEKLRHSGVADERCLVTVTDFSRGQRARILYNHLYFSDLPQEYKLEMLRDDFFLKIIDSNQFNPRIIEWLASQNRLKTVPPENYRKHVEALLKDPKEIWRHAFIYELSQGARDLLVALYSLSFQVYLEDLEEAFDRLHARSIERTQQKSAVSAFKSAMKELDGSFIRIGEWGVEFINPSVRDFIASILNEDPEIVLDVIRAAVKFNQVLNMLSGAKEGGPFSAARNRLEQNKAFIAEKLDQLLNTEHLRWVDSRSGRRGMYVDHSLPRKVEALFELHKELPEARPVTLRALEQLTQVVERGTLQYSELRGVVEYAWNNRGSGLWDDIQPLLKAVASDLERAFADDWLVLLELDASIGDDFEAAIPGFSDAFEAYQESGWQDERSSGGGREHLEELRSTLELIEQRCGTDFSSQISNLDAEIDEYGYDYDEPAQSARRAVDEVKTDIGDVEIRAMFRSLVDGE